MNSQTRSMEQAAHRGQQAKGQRKRNSTRMLTENSERGWMSQKRDNSNGRQGDRKKSERLTSTNNGAKRGVQKHEKGKVKLVEWVS